MESLATYSPLWENSIFTCFVFNSSKWCNECDNLFHDLLHSISSFEYPVQEFSFLSTLILPYVMSHKCHTIPIGIAFALLHFICYMLLEHKKQQESQFFQPSKNPNVCSISVLYFIYPSLSKEYDLPSMT